MLGDSFELVRALFDLIVGFFAAFGFKGRYSKEQCESESRLGYIITPVAHKSTSKL